MHREFYGLTTKNFIIFLNQNYSISAITMKRPYAGFDIIFKFIVELLI